MSFPMPLEFHLRPRAGVISLPRLRDQLETQLAAAEAEIAEARERGEEVALQERDWVRALRRYERLCDLLARRAA